MQRQLHLNLFIHSRGHHEASWRHPDSSSLALTDIRYYQDLAQRAEAALFDSIFFADQLALGGDVAQAARTWLEPITVLAAIAVSTSRIGLIATASTTYTEPFNLARQFASIDHISNGRAAWNIVTSWLATAARSFGGAGQVSHADRYCPRRGIHDRGQGIVGQLGRGRGNRRSVRWAICQGGPHPADQSARRFLPGGRPLNLPRCPQGRPVLVQAGSSDTGRHFAARHADAVFTAHVEKATAQEFYAAAEGRNPNQVLILPGLAV
jgi:alkanesulfonate monooxygenase SsuD/methylene tetrahydromethanopterin reductase-like flavin-dependent oxidoreductase (luciferase family)